MFTPVLALCFAQAPAASTVPAPDEERSVVARSWLLGDELNRYFSADDYPPAALRAEAEGLVRFRLEIGPNRRVSACTITASSGNSTLDSAACRIVRARVRYPSTSGPRGGPTATVDQGWVHWRLPPNRPSSPILCRPIA